MFDRPGEKLKLIALIDFILMLLGTIILAFTYGRTIQRYETVFHFGKFLIILVSGSAASYISALFLYGIGEMIDSNEKNADATNEMLAILKNNSFSSDNSNNTRAILPTNFKMSSCSKETIEIWTCTYCHTKNKASSDFCHRCSKYRKV